MKSFTNKIYPKRMYIYSYFNPLYWIWKIKTNINRPCADYLFWEKILKRKITPMNGNPLYKFYWYVFKERTKYQSMIFCNKDKSSHIYNSIHNEKLKNKYYGIPKHKRIFAFCFYLINKI